MITDEQVLSGAFTARSKKANGIAGVDLDHGTVASAPKHHNGSVVGTDLAREDVPSWPIRHASDDLERRIEHGKVQAASARCRRRLDGKQLTIAL